MRTTQHKLGYWTAMIGAVLTLIYLAAIAGIFISGTISPAEPYISLIGQVMNSAILNMLGIVAWGPGFIVLFSLLAAWFRNSKPLPQDIHE